MREMCPIIQSFPCHPSGCVIDISIIISQIVQIVSSSLFRISEQEPTSSDPDSDEEADLVLSLETETGLLTNQHTKGKRKLNWENEIIYWVHSDSN
jgi:hypothetical protein